MNFNDYTRVQLGIPRASSEAGVAAVRRARVMHMNGFGATYSDANIPLSGFYGREGDPWDVWMNEAARTWARVRGNESEAIAFRNRGVQLNGEFGKGFFESCSLIPLPSNVSDCNDIPWAGLACRGLPINFHPCESITRMSAAQVAQKIGVGILAFFKQGGSNAGQDAVPAGGGSDVGGDTGSETSSSEDKPDNTMLIVGGAVAVAALLAFFLKKRQ